MTDIIATLRAIAADPAAASAQDELQQIVSAWIERQRRRTEIAFAADRSRLTVEEGLTVPAT